MPILELYDTVVLKDDRKLYGTVERIHSDGEEPLDDCLIIAHVPVDPEALANFVKTGTPPRGYVFVLLAEIALGHVLVRQDQVELIDRTFAFGDFVKQQDSSMLGTIIDFAETFVLQPLWKTTPNPINGGQWSAIATGDTSRTPPHICGGACPVPDLPNDPICFPSDLIFSVPGQELKKANDTTEGNILVKDDFVGLVDDLIQQTTLIMEDGSIVVVQNAEELYVPIQGFGQKPLVSLPEFDPEIPRPDIVVAQHGWSETVPLPHDECHSGQLVVTNGKNLRQGRWLRGKYNSQIPHQGRIIDVHSAELHVRWLAVNPLIRTTDLDCDAPESELDLYENVKTFPSRSELRRDKTVMLVDRSKTPREVENRMRNRSTSSPVQDTPRLISPTDIQVGDQVKFRDQAGAAVKYQGLRTGDGVVHGAFERISPSSVFGFDLNNLKVVSTRQHVTVRWQDGTVSKHKSVSLRKHDLFETDFVPSDMVVAREGMMQCPTELPEDGNSAAWSPFNEMSVFEQPHDLRPQKVGLLQSVDSIERVAQVKWYTNPSVHLMGADHSVLSRSSRLGQLNDQIEDVSLYEIMTFPALTRRLSDLVIIAPDRLSSQAVDILRKIPRVLPDAGMAHASIIQPRMRLMWARYAAAGVIDVDGIDTSASRPALSGGSQIPDWCGEIISLGVDGSVVVRVNAGDYSRDVLVERDQFIIHIDEALLSWGGNSYSQDSDNGADSMSEDDWDSSLSDHASTISEIIEYEGGRRLDDDSDDNDWDDEVDDDEDEQMTDIEPDSHTTYEEQDGSMFTSNADYLARASDTLYTKNDRTIMHDQQRPEQKDNSISRLRNILNDEHRPASFAVLDTPPPSDQFQLPSDLPGDSPAFAKRMLKEHKILASSLPAGEIFVRTYESRLDLMRCLIIGPSDTPFELAPFVFDLQFTSRFPAKPPTAHFHSWTHGLGRINPNLYEEGKICLSLLGTWQGKNETESWTDKATVLQILISLQGLVFVPRPFYNEAGYEEAGEEDAYRVESLRYNEKAFVMARAFVKHALRNVVGGLEDVLAWIYLPYKNKNGSLPMVIDRARKLIRTSEDNSAKTGSSNDGSGDSSSSGDLVDGEGGSKGISTRAFLNPLSRGAIVMLKKTVSNLEEVLDLVNQHEDKHEHQ